MKILIATPVVGDACTTPYCNAMVRIARAFQRDRPQVEIVGPEFITSSQVSLARNVFASMVLEDASFSHLLFVDSDMGLPPNLVARMLDFDRPYVGALYPRRPPAALGSFVCEDELLPGPAVGGFRQARRVGTGILLLQRTVVEQIGAGYPDLLVAPDDNYRAMGVRERLFQGFEHIRDQRGLYLSEDLSFAKRWTDLGGEIWACVDEPIIHSGYSHVRGRFADKLQAPS